MSLRPVAYRTLLRTLSLARPPIPRLLLHIISTTTINTTPRRWNSTLPAEPISIKEPQPSYQLTFTCRPCQTRSTHTISKQAYHGGSVLICCPGCKNRHVIADNLKIFGDTKRTLEDLLKESGEVLKRARVLENGDIEMMPSDEEVRSLE